MIIQGVSLNGVTVVDLPIVSSGLQLYLDEVRLQVIQIQEQPGLI
jgi:hypothetical protein